MTSRPWTVDDAAEHVAVPGIHDDKYSRGVLGVLTGSDQYPGAAVLGVDAALHTGVGMVRYVGGRRATDLVLQRRPEAVAGVGRVQAWLIGSGMDHAARDDAALDRAVADGVPTVLDGGAIDLVHRASAPTVATPHYRELARLTGQSVEEIADDPRRAAQRAADGVGATVLVKGHTTWVAGPGILLSVTEASTWLATAGAGDALAGILGALVATHSEQISGDSQLLAKLAATAAVIHGRAARRASGGGPLTILELNASIPATIAELLTTP
jgi:NAD(P)H-hydrate repair Nnr-like enzyme with NAD(P)H-hydrate dehydratase domain